MSTDSGTIISHLAPGQPAFNVPTPTGGLVPDAPIPRDPTHFIYSQPHQVDLSGYTGAPLNDPNTTFGDAYCIGDTAMSGEFDDTLTFVRRWATIPADRFDYARVAVTYPGWYDVREPTSQTTTVQLEYEYFLIGPGETYETVDEIPLIEETRMTDTNGSNVSLLSGIFLNNGGGVLFLTDPTLTEYQTLVADDLADPTSYSIIIGCDPENYAGNIWARVTRRVKAK